MADTEPHWYVAHTYSGYENKVKMDIEKTIENRNLQDQILEVSVPMLNVAKEDDADKIVQQKMFPAYVLLKMYMNDDTWYVVRNTRGVTGFVGSGTDPIPLTSEEIRSMGFDDVPVNVDYETGDNVKVLNGPLENFIGVVQEINKEKHKVRVLVSMFGRETPVELEFSQVQKVN